MANQPIKRYDEIIKETRLQQLANSLVASRETGGTDITLVCQGKEFPAHRLVLEGSSSYFTALFKSGLEEAKSGIVHFRNMDSETLEAILDYLYKGEVKKIKTKEQIKKVLSASHMMELTELFEYCCSLLGESLSKKNFREIQKIVSTYKLVNLHEKLLAFALVYCNDTVDMSVLQQFSADKMKSMLTFAKRKRLRFDKLLTVLLSWLQYDWKLRERSARELFECVDAQLVSKSTFRYLLTDNKAASSEVISNILRELALTSALGLETSAEWSNTLSKDFQYKELKIVIFGESYDKISKKWNCVVQQFDVCSMSWLLSKRLLITESIAESSMCYFSGTVHMLGGKLHCKHFLYDIVNGCADLREGNNVSFSHLAGLSVCVFQNYLYVIGGSYSNGYERCVYCTKLGSIDIWSPASSLSCKRYSVTVLTSSEFIYVAGNSLVSSLLIIERSRGKLDPWEVINTEGIPRSVNSSHFVVFNNQLHVVCAANDRIEFLFYNQSKWQLRRSVTQLPRHVANINCVCPFPNVELGCIFTSTGSQCLPTHAWEPMSGQWKALQAIKGKCDVPNWSSKPFVFCAEV